MKRMSVVFFAVLIALAFAASGMAQAPKTEKPAPPEKAAPGTATDKPKTEKAKEPKAMKFSGTVTAYEAGKMLKVKGPKDKEMTFDLTSDTKTKGDVREGSTVTVMYKKDGDKMTASSVSASPAKKEGGKKEPAKPMEKK